MSNDLAKLVVKLEAQTAKYLANLEKAEKRANRWEKSAKKSVSSVGKAFSGLAIGYTIKQMADATAKQEAAVRQLEQAFVTTGNTADLSADKVAAYAAELQKVTTIGDEDFILAGAQLRTFTGIVDDEFKRVLELSADLSTRFGTDLKSSVLQLGKALNDPVKNLSALSRAGIQFSEDQKDVIKSLTESGRLQEAQKVILAELEVQFGGSARAARDEFGGALKALNNASGDLMEADSESLPAVVESINELTDTFSDPQFVENIQKVTSAMISGMGMAAKAISTTVGLAQYLGEEFAARVGGAALDDIPRVEQALERAKEKLDSINFTASNGINKNDPVWAQRVKDQEAEVARLEKQLDKARELRKVMQDVQPPASKVELLPAANDSAFDLDNGADPAAEEAARFEKAFGNQDQRSVAIADLVDADTSQADDEAKARKEAIEKAMEAEEAYLKKVEAIELAKTEARQAGLAAAENVFGGLAALMKEGSKEQRALLAAEKAVGAARALIAMNVAIAKANEQSDIWTKAVHIGTAISYGTQAVAAIDGVAVEGVAHGGLGNVPKEATYLLDKGERVLSPNQNNDLTEFLSQQDAANGMPPVEVNFNISAIDRASFQGVLAEEEQMIEGIIVRAFNRRGVTTALG